MLNLPLLRWPHAHQSLVAWYGGQCRLLVPYPLGFGWGLIGGNFCTLFWTGLWYLGTLCTTGFGGAGRAVTGLGGDAALRAAGLGGDAALRAAGLGGVAVLRAAGVALRAAGVARPTTICCLDMREKRRREIFL